jgi:hypothetical protein
MFTVTDDQAATTRAAFETVGEVPAAAALQRLFPGIANMTTAAEFARRIAGWMPRCSAAAPAPPAS